MRKLIAFVLVLAFVLTLGSATVLASGGQNAGSEGDGEVIQNGPCPTLGF